MFRDVKSNRLKCKISGLKILGKKIRNKTIVYLVRLPLTVQVSIFTPYIRSRSLKTVKYYNAHGVVRHSHIVPVHVSFRFTNLEVPTLSVSCVLRFFFFSGLHLQYGVFSIELSSRWNVLNNQNSDRTASCRMVEKNQPPSCRRDFRGLALEKKTGRE